MPERIYHNIKELRDYRKFVFGSVWKVDDRNVAMPKTDRTRSRSFHKERWVVVVSNCSENYHPLCPIVTIAPCSSKIEFKRFLDLELYKDADNVEVDCLLQLKLSQPILKVDLFDPPQGEISNDKKIQLQALIEKFYGLE